MLKRILVGLGMVVVVAAAVAARFWRVEVFDVFVLILSLGCAFEVVNKNTMRGKSLFSIPIMMAPLVVFLCYFFASSELEALLFQILALVVAFCACMIMEIMYPKTKQGMIEKELDPDAFKEGRLLERTKRTIGYCVYPSVVLGTLHGINILGVELGFLAILVVVLVSAFSDTFAFFFGVWLKGKRLCPEISPKKGVPGMIFGFVGGLVAAISLFAFFRFAKVISTPVETMNLAKCIVMFVLFGLVGSLLTQVGDLFESALKRNLSIKDFGNLFPGHGGFMDRLDGQMFNAVFVYVMMLLFI